jgi:hypothetical protein
MSARFCVIHPNASAAVGANAAVNVHPIIMTGQNCIVVKQLMMIKAAMING